VYMKSKAVTPQLSFNEGRILLC